MKTPLKMVSSKSGLYGQPDVYESPEQFCDSINRRFGWKPELHPTPFNTWVDGEGDTVLEAGTSADVRAL